MKDNVPYEVEKRLLLDDGSEVVLFDMLAAPPSVPDLDNEQNIVRRTPKGSIIWRISAQPPVYPRSPFTGMGYNEEGVLIAYRWDGTSFKVDIQTGAATPFLLTK